MKKSKGFLLLELSVVFLLLSGLLLFVISSFSGAVKTLYFAKDVQEAQTLAEQALFNEAMEVPAHLQVVKTERMVHGISLKEVQILDVKSGKIIFNLYWAQ